MNRYTKLRHMTIIELPKVKHPISRRILNFIKYMTLAPIITLAFLLLTVIPEKLGLPAASGWDL
ncbi:MAG: hypothetical protein AB7W16_11335 [Candidatus Obscuribacterales bacterium]